MSPDRQSPVTVDDLLRLKRAEQPDPKFWAQFESELRSKQLAAIVEKRPWWARHARLFGVLSRFSLPFGAAAALAVSVAGYREYQILARRGAAVPAESQTLLAQAAPAATWAVKEDLSQRTEAGDDEDVAATPSAVVTRSSGVVAVSDREAAAAAATATKESAAARTGEDLPVAGWLGRMDSAFARSVSASLTSAQQAEPEIIRNQLGFSRSLDAGLVPERRPVAEPLDGIVSTSAERRNRILGGGLPAVATSADMAVPSSEHLASRLSDDRLYESMSRLRVCDGGVSIKF